MNQTVPITEPSPEDLGALLNAGLRLHVDGRLDAAEAVYRRILAADPDHVQALGMLGTILAGRPGDEDEAEAVLGRHIALRPTDAASLHWLGRLKARRGDDAAAVALFERAGQWLPTLAPIFNDLGVSLHRLGRCDEALAALDRAVALDPDYGMAHVNRGAMLFESGRFDQALDAQLTALALLPEASPEWRAATLHNLLLAVRRTGRRAAAQAAVEIALAHDHADAETVDELALLLDYLDRRDDARALRNALARRTGIERNGPGEGAAQATLLLLGGVGAGHIPTRYLVDVGRFATLSVGLLSPDQADAPLGPIDLGGLRGADVIFNTLGEVDAQGDQFDAVDGLCASLGRPVLNPPAAIRRTGRDQAAALFGDIADMVVPAVEWTTPDALAVMAIDAPVLVRPAGDHGGENLVRLRDGAERDAYLRGPRPATSRLLLTRFHDFRSADGRWRKYRLIFVDRQVFPYHLAIGDDWLLHYWRANMSVAPWKMAEEARFLADWRGVFGPRAAAAAQAAALRLDLDYGGMDCALLDDGRLLLFEANACFLLHLDEPEQTFGYKHQYVPPIRAAFSDMVIRRARGEP